METQIIQSDTIAGASVSTGDYAFTVAAPTLWNRLLFFKSLQVFYRHIIWGIIILNIICTSPLNDSCY
jgi:hypothetical protein